MRYGLFCSPELQSLGKILTYTKWPLNLLSYRLCFVLKDVIIRGGENIYPTEVEQFLYKHPKIQDVQVSASSLGLLTSSYIV